MLTKWGAAPYFENPWTIKYGDNVQMSEWLHVGDTGSAEYAECRLAEGGLEE